MDRSSLMLTPEQVRAFDRLAIEELGIPSIVLMENAGRNAAELIDRRMSDRNCNSAQIVCGTGNNGGDGFVIGRHLANRGRNIRLFFVGAVEKVSPDCRTNRDIALAMRLPVIEITRPSEVVKLSSVMNADALLIDALLGTGFTGPVREPLATVIRTLNSGPKAGVVAVDVPSGLNAANGVVDSVAVKADLTVTFVALKSGFRVTGAADYLGEVRVVDIGAPMSLMDRIILREKSSQATPAHQQ